MIHCTYLHLIPTLIHAHSASRTGTIAQGHSPGRCVAACPEVDSPSVDTIGTGMREIATHQHVVVFDSAGTESRFSTTPSSMISSSNLSSAQGFQSGSSGSGSSSSPAAPPVRHGTQLQHGISKPKVYIDGMVWYSKPQHHSQALCDERWKKTMDNEFDALLKNKTWHLVPPKAGTNIIDCNWVYTIKWKSDGSIDRYKAQLGAKRFKQ
jgi:hypothetical protein